MQPSSSDPTNSTGQSSSSSQPEELSMSQPPHSLDSTGQPYPLSLYPQTGSPVAPPPPLGSYPPGEEAYYRQLAQDKGPITQYHAQIQEKISEPAKPKRNGWKIIATILAVLVLILATTTTTLLLTRPSVQQTGRATSPVGATPTVQPTPVATQTAQPISTSTATQSTPAATTSPSNYSAVLPGLGCDTNGGTWTQQGLDGISCPSSAGTQLVINASNSRGYLYLQLPNSKPFSSNNTISITGVLGDNAGGYQTKCVGLAEEDANGGYAVEYCNTGNWFIASISNGGVILQKLHTSVTTTMTTVEISLAFQGAALSFLVDNNKISTADISSIQPVKVAIIYDCVGYGASNSINGNYLLVNGFTYTTQSS